ncbi:MAG: hypothetical protein M3096_02425 [Actinomycetia bacterium]|nr:hypothetical protein [Actinomycetes bacterium]
MRLWLMVTVAAVALTACTDAAILGPDSDNEGETVGNTALFCRAWPEARRTVVNVLEGEDQRFQDAGGAAVVDETMAQYDRAVPSEIRTEWDRLYAIYTRASDLVFTAGYAGHTIRTEHVTMMFGPGGMDAASVEASNAIEAIDEWSVTACGDFCSRWPELRNVVLVDPNHWVFQGHGEDIEPLIEREEETIHVGSVLVPPEIADAWGIAAILKSRLLAMGRQYGRGAFQGEEGMERLMQGMGMSDEAMYEKSLSAVETMEAWVATNCDAASLTGGAPGTLSVRIRPRDDLVGRTILLALLPVGTDFGSVTAPSEYIGASCREVYDPPELVDREVARTVNESGRSEEEILDEWFRPEPLQPMLDVGEYHMGNICWLVGHDYDGQGPGELVFPGGSYELFAGTFIGNPGSYDLYFAAPERCTQITMNVDGDTVVDLPELDECDLAPIGSAEEIARRASAPVTGRSHLWVEIPSAVHQEGSPGQFTAVLVPAGTTLGEIGRGNAWPVGGFRFGYAWLDDDEGDPRRTLSASESGLAPILPYGPGGGVVSLGPQIDREKAWDAFFPEPVGLAPGSYDLRIHGEDGSEDCYDDSCRRQYCGSAVVAVSGDTVVPLPEWGECP